MRFTVICTLVFSSSLVFAEQPFNPSYYGTFSVSRNGGTGVQVTGNSKGKQSVFAITDSAGATSLGIMTKSVKAGDPGHKANMPSSGQMTYLPEPATCSTSDAMTKKANGLCDTLVTAASAYSTAGTTIDTTGLTGGYLVKLQTSTTCDTLDPYNLSSYTFYGFSAEVSCGSGTRPCQGKSACAHLAYRDSGNKVVLVQTSPSRTTLSNNSMCFVATVIDDCGLEP